MYGKPYHKMPVSSWMIPGGNRDQKRKLIREQKYPMKSAIQKNLGGPLSEVFFSYLSPSQQDHIGYTPKLQGPGRDLWVSPSDNLIGKVVLSPPYTSRLRQALTHQGIVQMGAEIEQKVLQRHQLEIQIARQEKERQMLLQVDMMIREAVHHDRKAQQLMYNQLMEKANCDITETYEAILEESLTKALLEGTRNLEEAVARTKRELENELCIAFEAGQANLSKQYEFQLALRSSNQAEKYENQLKKHRQDFLAAMDTIQKEFVIKLKKTIAKLEAEHVTDLLIQSSERSQKYHEEKINLENAFGTWFVKHFEKDMVKKDFTILELEDEIKKVKDKCKRREDQLKEVFRHFQKFINFALKEKPGQGEFLLSLQKELKNLPQEIDESEVDLIARMIIEYIIASIQENKALADFGQHTTEPGEFTKDNFREKIQSERENNRMMQLVGEEQPPAINQTLSQAEFMKKQANSLANMLERNPTMQRMLEVGSTFSDDTVWNNS